GLEVVRIGVIMSGVVAAMRRTLLSCTFLAHGGRAASKILATGVLAGLTGPVFPRPAQAIELPFLHAFTNVIGLSHQEFAALTTALSLLGFSVVATILLMRTRLRAARFETGLLWRIHLRRKV